MIGDVVRDRGVEYVVIFDGAHAGKDLDILSDGLSRIAEKITAPSKVQRLAGTAIVEAALMQHGALTIRQIAVLTGVSSVTVWSGVARLRRQGRLATTWADGRAWWRNAETTYELRA